MYIKSGPHRILLNVNLEDEEMIAITALPELLTLALAVQRGDYEQLTDLTDIALKKAGIEV
jgi:hypothetical protein